MAESLDDGEFWLPPSFLTDDDILMDMGINNNSSIKKKSDNNDSNEMKNGFDLFPLDFSCGGFGSFGLSSSDLSSPVESVVGSTETESDEEDFIAGLTRQMAHSTLEQGFKRADQAFASEKTKGLFLSGSPQSTLCAIGSGCGCKQGSSRGSPNCQSIVSSPPGTWDLLYAAAGEVARMRMSEESYGGHRYNRGGLLGGCGLPGPPRKQSPVSVPVKNHNQNFIDHVGFYSQHHQSLTHQKLQQVSQQFQQLKQQQQQQLMKQQQSSSVWGGGPQQTKGTGQYPVGLNSNIRPRSNNTTDFVGTRSNGRPLGLSPSAWPPLQQQQPPTHTQQQQQQQQNGSGMRAVFLGAPGAKRECAGTGVFLPRRINTPTETRKKPACSTVLLPAKVVQALNLNFDEMGAPLQPRFGSYTQDSDAALRFRNGNGNGNGLNHQKRSFRSQPGMMNHHEVRLPPEWTY
ncbi:hypothetical protein Ddye_010793 [Dipteronia dyeriana]|uniref:Uncharacterized protein n=1 Tax=Dipteronia dyeriana TaxID=168575 RepID=A0AAD9XEJ1_9ROSI|nr:hypothetical protein Ddye_010793 [Dipteronia dyeriana]